MRAKGDRLPKEFKKYFWDVDFKTLSLKKYPIFVLERIMKLGDLRALRWLLKVPKKKIMKVLENSRELDKKTRNYWRVIYGG